MPIISVHKSSTATSPYIAGGTQYIENQLIIPSSPNTTTLYLSNQVYTRPGYYVLFDYSESSNPNPVPSDFSPMIIDTSDLDSSLFQGTYSLYNVPAEKKVILRLNSNVNGGTQYIEGTLSINSPTSIYLNSFIYATPATYVLFDWSGGGSFSGDISNITIIPPRGRGIDTGVSPNGCAISGNTITVTLV